MLVLQVLLFKMYCSMKVQMRTSGCVIATDISIYPELNT